MFFQAPRAAVNKTTSVPAPIGGLNARDSLVAMPQTDASVMQNWWPQPYGCTVRRGYREWATGMPSAVDTIADWADTNGAKALFAWSDDSVFDVTVPGAVGAALVTGLTNSLWQFVNMVNASGGNLIAVNGVDDGIIYNFAGGMDRIVLGDGIVPNTWAGLDPALAAQLCIHQHRLWAVEVNTSSGWFLPPDAIQGTFVEYDFGPLFTRGGGLSFLATWTIDDGNGAEDHLVAVSTQGEAVVFGGTDPTDDAKWALVGVYYIGAPVSSRNGFTKAGGDLLILTQQGVVSMAAQLVSTKVQDKEIPVASAKIQFLMSTLIAEYSALDGWAVEYYAKFNMLLVNVPSTAPGGNIQLASNQLISAWTQFTAMDASSWGIFDLNPMFGTYDGRVMQGWYGTTDEVLIDGSGGTSIVTAVQQAYSYLGDLATQKQVGMFRPTFVVNAALAVNATILYDFVSSYLSTPTTSGATSVSLWGTGIWGSAIWGGGDTIQKGWIQAEGMGVAASLAMVTQSDGEALWVSTDYSFLPGVGLF